MYVKALESEMYMHRYTMEGSAHTRLPMCLRRLDMGERLWLLLRRSPLQDLLRDLRRYDLERDRERLQCLRELRWECELERQTERFTRLLIIDQQFFNNCSLKCITYLDFDLDRDRDRDQDLEREWWEPSLERAGERAGERLADFPEPRGLKLLDAERDS